MSEFLTEKQEAVLKFIEEYQMNHGKSPTLKEIREYFNVSSDNGVLKHLKALREKGFIEKDDTPRGIKLLNSVRERLENNGGFKLPVFGYIPAGGPVVSDEYVNSWMTVGEDLASNKDDFYILQVKGNSMIDAGIFEGDLVIVNKKKEPRGGDIVVALVDNANTLKRFIKENGKVYLRAENREYNDIYPEESLVIQGIVTCLIRNYN